MANRGLLGIALTALVTLGWAVVARAGEEKSD